jgi:hypothetical protein
VLIGGIMSTATTASPMQSEPELLGQTVVVIGGRKSELSIQVDEKEERTWQIQNMQT